MRFSPFGNAMYVARLITPIPVGFTLYTHAIGFDFGLNVPGIGIATSLGSNTLQQAIQVIEFAPFPGRFAGLVYPD